MITGKKFCCILSCILFSLSLCACGKESSVEKQKVKVTIPAMVLSEKDLADLDGYCEKNSYIKARYNQKDGTVTLTMTKSVNNLMLVDIGMNVVSALYDYVESETFPYCKEIVSYERDFTKVTVAVDKKAYQADKTSSLLPMGIGETCLLYGMYTPQDDPQCEVTVIDVKSREILSCDTYGQSQNP